MECDWELRGQGDVRYVLTRIPPDVAAIIEHAAQTDTSLGLKFRKNKEGGVLRWAKGVPHELVRSAVEAAVTGGRAVTLPCAVALSRTDVESRSTASESSETSGTLTTGTANDSESFGAAIFGNLEDAKYRREFRFERMFYNGVLDRIDAFADFAENYRWRKGKEFVRWLEFSDDLHVRLTTAVEKHCTHHAIERAWERLPLGPVQLLACLSSRHKVMEFSRLRFFVEGAGSVDFTSDVSTFLDYSDQRFSSPRTPSRRDEGTFEHLEVTDRTLCKLVHTIQAAATKRHIETSTPRGDDERDATGADDSDNHYRPPLSFVQSFTNGLRTKGANAFRVPSLRVLTTLGTLVFDATGTTLITFISDDGDCNTWLSAARIVDQQNRWRWQTRIRALRS